MSYQVIFTITNSNDTEMLTSATWLKNNYGGKIHQALGRSDNYAMNGVIISIDFNDMVDTITALKNEFTDRVSWQFQVKDLV